MEFDRLVSPVSTTRDVAAHQEERERSISPLRRSEASIHDSIGQHSMTGRPSEDCRPRSFEIPNENEPLNDDRDAQHASSISKSNEGFRATVEQDHCPDSPAPPWIRLRYSVYVLILVLLYATLTLFSWVIICILTFRPLTTGAYGIDGQNLPHGYGWASPSLIHALYTKNEEYLQAAQVIRSLVAVLTIPLVSTVCSKAAVTFVQQRSRKSLSLRQMMTLADRGWTDPFVCFRLLSGGFKQYGTKFLVATILLNLIGGIIAPLQSLFLTTITIKTPTYAALVPTVTDILDQFNPTYMARRQDNNELAVLVRAAITTNTNTSPQGRLWTVGPVDCKDRRDQSDVERLPAYCEVAGTLNNVSALPDPFLAQLPSAFGTGLIRQYLPRINSTAHRDVITEAEFPVDCNVRPGAFYRRFASTGTESAVMTGWGNWSLVACMPANLTQSPWRETRDRQDFKEELYVNISLLSNGPDLFTIAQGGFFRITLETTAGYFELPNYMNSQHAGPLLDTDPMTTANCVGNCSWQAQLNPEQNINSTAMPRMSRDTINTVNNATLALEMHPNRGPLATTALALFGSGSFIEERTSRPEAFYYPNVTLDQILTTPNYGACVSQAPFLGLMRASDIVPSGIRLEPCLRNMVHDYGDVQRDITAFVYSLYRNHYDGLGGERITNAFTAAAFLANEAWLLNTSPDPTWNVAYDYGADTIVPVISLTGIIVISALLGVFLAALFGLAVYSVVLPRWTDQLDAFAMLRIGASIAPSLQFRAVDDARKIVVLDELPGWIGDATHGEGGVGELALGAPGRLDGRRKFAAYDSGGLGGMTI